MGDDDLVPTPAYLRQRATHYRALAAKATRPDRAADYLNTARILENEAAEMVAEEKPVITRRAG
jgi:hypothetical protein